MVLVARVPFEGDHTEGLRWWEGALIRIGITCCQRGKLAQQTVANVCDSEMKSVEVVDCQSLERSLSILPASTLQVSIHKGEHYTCHFVKGVHQDKVPRREQSFRLTKLTAGESDTHIKQYPKFVILRLIL